MAVTLPAVPEPPPADVARFDAQGRPTVAQVAYDLKMKIFLAAVKAAAEAP